MYLKTGRIARVAQLTIGGLALAAGLMAQSSEDLLMTGLGQDLSVSDAYPKPMNSSADLSAGMAGRGRDSHVPDVRDRMGDVRESRPTETQEHRRTVVDPPTEYQTFVKNSADLDLPIFGASLFNEVPTTFAPLDRVPVTPDYTVGPGDELELRLWGQINANERLVVDRSGDVFLPQVGRISVSGLRFIDLQPAMKNSIGRVFRNFEMTVNMGQLRSIQVFVMGRARRPGSYTVSSLSTLVNALFVSGGPSPQGSMRAIQVKRAGRVVSTFDMYDLLLRGDKSHDIALQPGDVIYIPKAGPRVAIGGSVETAAIYEVAPNSSLGEVLGYAGGLSPVAEGQHAILERVNARATLVSQNIELTDAGLDTTLQDGDIVKLLQVVPRFNKTVTLKGNVADAVRLPWHDGMKISDVIPDKRALLTREYWTEHNRLVAGSAQQLREVSDKTDGAMAMAATLVSAESKQKQTKTIEFDSKNDVQLAVPDINWRYAVIERLDAQTLTTRLVPFDLGKVVLDHDASEDKTLEAGDVITVFSKADFLTPVTEQTRFVKLEGEVKMAGVYSVQPGETLRQLIERAGGLTDKAYLYGAEFTRESTKREQQKRYAEFLDQLQRNIDQSSSTTAAHALTADQEMQMRAALEQQRTALERLRKTAASGRIVLDVKPDGAGVSSLPDLPLENGDRFVIPTAPSTVNVVGTVFNQGSFLYAPGQSTHDYLRQAGGPTRYADRKQLFVIRADGSVWSKPAHSGFDSAEMYPGDTLVVPTTIAKGSAMRNVIEWSQAVSGVGVSAAAVNVLK